MPQEKDIASDCTSYATALGHAAPAAAQRPNALTSSIRRFYFVEFFFVRVLAEGICEAEEPVERRCRLQPLLKSM